ncbi:MAG: hypothetical protein WCC17_22385 [Candidatus Nitrosopolaris sp.]
MEKQDVINVLEFVKYNQLRTLQWKAAYLRYQINMPILDAYIGIP